MTQLFELAVGSMRRAAASFQNHKPSMSVFNILKAQSMQIQLKAYERHDVHKIGYSGMDKYQCTRGLEATAKL